jgi:hypothetical protein
MGIHQLTKGDDDMSTDFQLKRPITATDLFGGRLDKHGVREHIAKRQDMPEWATELEPGFALPPEAPGETQPGTMAQMRCLTDGTNYVWVEISKRGFVAMLTRYGDSDPNAILDAIEAEFDTAIISEHEMDYVEFWDLYRSVGGEVVAIDLSDFEEIEGSKLQ